MSNLLVKEQKIFAEDGTKGVFGTGKTGTKQLTEDPAEIQNEAYEDGWDSAVIGENRYVAQEDLQGIQFVQSYNTRYLQQKGICEWISTMDYYANSSFCQSGGVIYQCIQDNTGQAPSSNPDYWLPISKKVVNQTQITDVILENPRLVNLSLSDGTLTMAAGSTVIVPYGKSAPTYSIGQSLNGGTITDISWDGTNLFYYVRYDGAKSVTLNSGEKGFFVHTNGNIYHGNLSSQIYSGTTQPSITYGFWYDTTNNIVKFTSEGTSWHDYVSLMFATGTFTDTGLASIDQTFDSIGYIGSSFWVCKGVKGLSCDGFNSDGSYKNTPVTTSYVKVYTNTSYTGNGSLQLITNSGTVTFAANYYEQETAPANITYTVWLNTNENIKYLGNGTTWTRQDSVNVGSVTYSAGRITSFNVRDTFETSDKWKLFNINNVYNGSNTFTANQIFSGTDMIQVYTNPEADVNVNPSAPQRVIRLTGRDKNDYGLIYVDGWLSTQGNVVFDLIARNWINGNPQDNILRLASNKNGTRVTQLNGKTLSAFVTSTYSNGSSWYRIWSDNWCEQGGIILESTSGNVFNTITFLKAFKDTNYTSLMTSISQTYSYPTVDVRSRTAASMYVNRNNSYGFSWYVAGYIA